MFPFRQDIIEAADIIGLDYALTPGVDSIKIWRDSMVEKFPGGGEQDGYDAAGDEINSILPENVRINWMKLDDDWFMITGVLGAPTIPTAELAPHEVEFWPDVSERDGCTATAEVMAMAFRLWTQEPEMHYSTLTALLPRVGAKDHKGVKWPFARIADYMVQKARKAGIIKFDNKVWHVV